MSSAWPVRLDPELAGPGVDLIPPQAGGLFIQQGAANFELENSNKHAFDYAKWGIQSGLNMGSAAGNRYAEIGSLTFSGMNWLNYATNDPSSWACMNCHQYFRDEVQEAFGYQELFSLRY